MKIEKLILSKEKRAWIRIVEAFTAILIVMSALLIIVSRQKANYNSDDEIIRIQSAALNYIGQDEILRGQILNKDTTGVYAFLKNTVPSALNYSAYVCNYNDVCPNLDGPLDSKVSMYTQSRPIVANLTYSPEKAVKIQIYFWKK